MPGVRRAIGRRFLIVWIREHQRLMQSHGRFGEIEDGGQRYRGG